ncbi:putative calcium-binding protein CML46 [Camellia lanceoleosa]|nr:putative calcium-binding protein CML46 [Camellia lanceoleosa]
MESTPTMTPSSGLQLFFTIVFPDTKLHKIFSDAKHFLQTLSTRCKPWNNMKPPNTEPVNQQCFNENHIDVQLCSEELNMVMNKLGLPCDINCGCMIGAKEVLALFDEEKPCLEEVKEAFDVFDENRDGFIDATELQRVLYVLGLNEVSELEDCKRMISGFDENGDGVIDFSEFVKFMEMCFL